MKNIQIVFFFLFATILSAQEIEIFNTSINTSYAEFGITYFNSNTILFASSKKVESDKNFSKSRRENNQQLYLELFKGIVAENGDIIETGKFSNEKDSKFFESDISFTPDGKTIYFTWNNFYNTQTRKDSAKWKSLQLMKASINERFEISNSTHLPFNSEAYSVRYPEVSKDGKQLFFVSDMPNGIGGNDIYVVDIFSDGTYGEPKNLGSNVNTKLDELFPFVDENNTLYFSSYGHKGLGSLDVFKSEFKDNNYLPTENLPAPINSKYDDFGYVINNSNNSGYFTSNRKDSKGDVDIYAFKIKEKECLQTISGLVFNEKDNKKVPQVSVRLFIENELKETQVTLEDSKFNFKIKCNESYKIVTEKEGFISSEIELKTDNNGGFVNYKDIILAPIECFHSISGFVYNESDNKQLHQAKVSLFVNNELKETRLTQAGSKFNFIINCDASFKIVAEKEGFLSSEVTLITDNKPYFLIDEILFLKPVDCIQTISGFVLNEKDNKQLSQVNVSLFINEVLTETQITKGDLKFKFNVNCNSSFKIVAKKEGFLPSEVTGITDNKLSISNDINIILTPEAECIQTISGFVFNETDNQQIHHAKVSLFENNELIDTQLTQLDSKYNFRIKCDSNYKIIAEKDGFITSELDLLTNNVLDFSNNKNIMLAPVECVQTISGFVFNEQDNKQLSQAKVSLFINDVITDTQITQVDLKFNFNIKCGVSYTIIAEKDGFLTSKLDLLTNNVLDFSNNKNIILKPIICKSTISGLVIDKVTKKPLSKAIVQIFKAEELVENTILDTMATFNFSIDCKTDYKIVTTLNGYKNEVTYFKTAAKNSETIFKEITLEPVEEFVSINNTKLIKTDVIYFDLDSDEIRPDAAIEINKVIGLLIKYPTTKIEVSSHTDSRAPDNYNLILSEKRANAVIKYMVINGIDVNRLIAKGYGETQLVNKCSNGVNCTNAEHELNRRTEFKIIEE